MGGVLSLCCTQDLFKDAPTSAQRCSSEIGVLARRGAGSACVRLAGVVETPGELLLTELCGGGDLMHHVEGQRKFTAAARGLLARRARPSRCHAVSVAHRDVKPENMLVAFDGRRRARVRLSDFGSACVFARATATPPGAGPLLEQPEAWALDYDHRGDVYSVGVVLLVLVDGMLGGDERRAAALAALVAVADGAARRRVGRAPRRAGLPRAARRSASFAARGRSERASGALAPATPDLVLVHRPFALEALATLGPGDRAASALTRPRRRAAPRRPAAASSQDPRASPGAGTGPAAPPAVGRRNAPGADGGRGAISMDGTYSGLVGIFADGGGGRQQRPPRRRGLRGPGGQRTAQRDRRAPNLGVAGGAYDQARRAARIAPRRALPVEARVAARPGKRN
ncbi:serine/threonine kinase [Aureococcus anophagefferens]|nr:serine/threonine kinase [Aureococcus anophagefferens]